MSFVGVSSRNEGQKVLSSLLMNDKPFLFVTGKAGTGKTLLTQAVGIHRTIDRQDFNKVVYTRMQMQLGDHLGYLSGDINEKTVPFIRPFFDNLEVMNLTQKHENALKDEKKKRIFFDPIQTMRGGSFHRSFIMIDEAQNLDGATIAGIATRIANNSKMVFLGNFSQIDDKGLRHPSKNGLFKLLHGLYEGGKGSEQYFDHITLTDQERNPVVDVVEQILRNHDTDPKFEALESKGLWWDIEYFGNDKGYKL